MDLTSNRVAAQWRKWTQDIPKKISPRALASPALLCPESGPGFVFLGLVVMADLYSIQGWDEHFENAQSRKYQRLSWFRCPNKHDGKGFRRIMDREDGAELFAAWMLIVQVASKCPDRGVLADDKPLTAEDLHFKTGAPTELFVRAFAVFSSDEIGWLLVVSDHPATTPSPPRAHYTPTTGPLDKIREEKRREEDTPNGVCSEQASEPSAYSFPVTGSKNEWNLPLAKLGEYVEVYPGLKVTDEIIAARQWCRDNPKKRKTSRGMQAFLTAWLNRTQNKRGGSGSNSKSISEILGR